MVGFVDAACGLLCLAVTRIGGSCVPCDGSTGVGGIGGVCARAFTHKSDSITAIDAKKNDTIAAPEPDHGSPTNCPHHGTASKMLSIKVHTGGRNQPTALCVNAVWRAVPRQRNPQRPGALAQPSAVVIHRKYLILFR